MPTARLGLGRRGRVPDEPGGMFTPPAEPEQGARQVRQEEHADGHTSFNASAGSTSPRRTSPGTRSRGTRSPGRTRPGTSSPGPMSPGATSPGQMSRGPTSPGRMSPGPTPPTRMRPKATRAATRTATSSPRSRRTRSWPTRRPLPTRGHAPGGDRKPPSATRIRQAHRRTGGPGPERPRDDR